MQNILCAYTCSVRQSDLIYPNLQPNISYFSLEHYGAFDYVERKQIKERIGSPSGHAMCRGGDDHHFIVRYVID